MSRIGKLPIMIPEGVIVKIDNLSINIKGPKGEISKKFVGKIGIIQEENQLKVVLHNENAKAMWGTARSIINSMVKGVHEGFKKELEMKGVGYAASVSGNYLNLSLGKSHGTKICIPDDIKVEVSKQNIITLHAVDKERIGQFAAQIIRERPVEHYKAKGIKLKGQYVQIKVGKKN